jgi:hypothetical protein
MEYEQDVTVEAETTTESSPEENEQETTDSEVVENTVPDVQANLRIALQKERERRKAAEAQLQRPQYQEPVQEDDTVKRFLNVEATTLINNKLLTDPAFKDRVDLVKDEMETTGRTLEDADNAVLARLFREMNFQTEEKPKNVPPNQLPNTATPETPKVDPSVKAELDEFDRMAKSFG